MRRTVFLLVLLLAAVLGPPLFRLPSVHGAPVSLSTSTTNVAIPPGSSGSVYITATSNGFTGTLPLSTSISGVGVTASLNPASLVLSAGGSAVSQLSFTLPLGTATGWITVIGSTSAGNAYVDVMVTAGQPGPDFKVQCCFSTGDGQILVTAGSTYNSWAWVFSLNNFTGTVNLGLSLPFTSSISPSTVTLTSGATLEPNISVSPPSTTPGGTYAGSLTGTSGSITRTIPLSVIVSPAPPPPQGIVCFSPVATSCPSSPAKFTAPVGSTFTTYIVIQGSQSFNGFNIWFGYDPSVLNATTVSLAGSVLPNATTVFECINGKGSSSCGSWLGNGPGIVALYAKGGNTTSPTTGLLYSVTYKVIGNSTGSSFGFFCTTSPSGPWINNCANVFSSAPVNVQGATFVTSSADPPIGGGGGGGRVVV